MEFSDSTALRELHLPTNQAKSALIAISFCYTYIPNTVLVPKGNTVPC